VNKGPGRPVFGDEQRAYQLAHLSIVDYVVVVPHPHAVEAIEKVRPDVLLQGTEYASPRTRRTAGSTRTPPRSPARAAGSSSSASAPQLEPSS